MDKIMIQVEEILKELKHKNEEVISLNEEIQTLNNDINLLTKELEEKFKTIKSLQNTPETLVSRLATTSTINPIIKPDTSIPTTSSLITMSDKLKYPQEYLEAFEKITKFYDYKANNTIVRNGKFGKYPRYICRENADPTIVKSLFNLGFVDKIMVDETLTSIAQLPTLVVQSVQSMMESYGPGGTYGVQIFDASTDLKGKPIMMCQIFKAGRNTNVEGDNTSLKAPMPCKLEQFGDWICNKRAIGIATLKTKIEDLIRGGKACVIGTNKGGMTEEMVTVYFNNDIITRDTSALSQMHSRLVELKHTHAPKTIEFYKQIIAGQRKRTVITLKNPSLNEGESSNPFG